MRNSINLFFVYLLPFLVLLGWLAIPTYPYQMNNYRDYRIRYHIYVFFFLKIPLFGTTSDSHFSALCFGSLMILLFTDFLLNRNGDLSIHNLILLWFVVWLHLLEWPQWLLHSSVIISIRINHILIAEALDTNRIRWSL